MTNKAQHALDVKTDPQYKRISDRDLKTAAQFALLEAGGWDDAVSVLQQYDKKFDCQTCVMAMYSIELYLKAILMAKGINVTVNTKHHDIDDLFNKLSDSEQQKIKEGIIPSGIDLYDLMGDYIKLDTFESELAFISKDFVQLRYQYEKYMNGEPIYILQDFIIALRNNVRKLAKGIVYSEK